MHIFRGASAAVIATAFLAFSGVAQAQTTINFLSAEKDATFAPVIASFEKLHPDIKVVHQTVPFDDLNAAIESRVGQGDTSIDVIAADTPRIPAFASKGYLLNLDDRADDITAAVPNPVDIEQVSYDGSIYAYPMWTSTQLLFFNRDMLKAGDIAPPSDQPDSRITWSELLDKAQAAQAAGAKWGLMFEQVDRYYQLQSLYESAGAGSGLTGPGNVTVDITNPEWIKTSKWYGDTFANGISPRGVAPEQAQDLFVNKEVAFFVTGPWAFQRFNSVDDLDYGVAYTPYFAGGKPVTATGSWAIALNPHSQKLAAARMFAEYATLNAEGAYLTVSANPLPPTNAEAYKTYAGVVSELTPKIGPAIDIISYESQKTAVGRPRSIGYVAYETVMNRAFSDIRNGADVEQTLTTAQKTLDRQMARLK